MENDKMPEGGVEVPGEMTGDGKVDLDRPNEEKTIDGTGKQHKERNGFTTFYLQFGLIVNALMILLYISRFITRRAVRLEPAPIYGQIFGIASSVVMVWGFYALIRWKRYGFYILLSMALISQIFTLTSGADLSYRTFFPVAAIALLFAVLQIRKNGKSCWEQLS